MLNPAIVAKIDYHARELDKTRSDLINYILFDCLRDFGAIPEDTKEDIEGQIEVISE